MNELLILLVALLVFAALLLASAVRVLREYERGVVSDSAGSWAPRAPG